MQILTFLWRASGRPVSTTVTFSALSGDYAPAANWARENGLIDDSFNPNASCTRAQATGYIWQVFGKGSAPTASFTDVSGDASFAYTAAINWSVENGIVEGYPDGSFHPNTVCNRGVIVTMLHRAYVEKARLKG